MKIVKILKNLFHNKKYILLLEDILFDRNQEIKELKQELFLAQKALLKATEKNYKE